MDKAVHKAVERQWIRRWIRRWKGSEKARKDNEKARKGSGRAVERQWKGSDKGNGRLGSDHVGPTAEVLAELDEDGAERDDLTADT